MRKIVYATLAACLMLSVAACGGQDAKPEQQSEPPAIVTAADPADGEAEATTGASVDGTTSASIVPEAYVQKYQPQGFTDSDKKKALFVIGDPRKNSVNYDMAYTAMKHFEDNGLEVEARDLYEMKFQPVITPEEFYYAKDGTGEPAADVVVEQDLVRQATYIIFVYPNWHDTPNAMVKGYMERVFAKKFAYQNTADGLEGMLTGKSIFTIMNCGYLGGGRGFIGDGVGMNDALWDEYMAAFKVLDDDTAGFWGVENKGRFVNDRTPANESAALSTAYEKEIEKLRKDLTSYLDKIFFTS